MLLDCSIERVAAFMLNDIRDSEDADDAALSGDSVPGWPRFVKR
jgi:hypothetical protein